MLIEHETRPVATGGMITSVRATIQSSVKMFHIFTDQTYSNIIEAICRELVANAIDAHVAAGNPDPIHVFLPTDLDPTFRVIDKGIGMSREFMLTKFPILGNGSTKDQRPDMIGGFGAGRFSALGLSDQFSICSTQDGQTGIYTMYKDHEGYPCVGDLGQRPTNAPSGTEISFPVKPSDFAAFATAAQAALIYFDPMPIIHNADITPPDYVSRGKGWAIRKQSGSIGVIMGGVRYPVQTFNLGGDLRNDDRISGLMEYGLDLQLPIGACEIALSREALTYTDKTKNNLRAALHAVVDEVAHSFSTMFDHLPTEWEAKQALWLEVPADQSYGSRGQFLLKQAKYRGDPLDTNIKLSTGAHGVIDTPSRRSSSHSPCPSPSWRDYRFDNRFDRFSYVIIDDLEVKSSNKNTARIKKWVDDHGRPDKDILILRNPVFKIDIPFDDPMFLKTSDMPAPETAPRTKYDRPKVRMYRIQSRCFNPRSTTLTREIDYCYQPNSGILIVGDQFEISYNDHNMVNTRLVSLEECYVVNSGDGKKLLGAKNTGWRLLQDVFAERLQATLLKHPNLPEQLAMDVNNDPREIFYAVRHLTQADLPINKQNSALGKIVALHDTYVKPLTQDLRNLRPFLDTKMPDGVDIKPLLDRLNPKVVRFLKIATNLSSNSIDLQILKDII